MSGVRLAGGRSLCSGRVEVLRGTSWDTICEADFDMKDAEVVCRQLDCGFPAELLRGAYFGEGQGLIRTEEIQCRGNETRIHDCPTSTREHQSCAHSNDISLVCTEYSGYRLVDGPDSCSGRVELQYRGEYRTVCDQYWDLRDATVLCQQLGCGEAVAAPGQAWFGQGSGSRGVWTEELQCQGNESQIFSCPKSSTTSQNCTHENNVGLVCFGYTGFRLVNGSDSCSGRVELQWLFKDWGTVCDLYWDLTDASVLCQQLGCGEAVAAPGQAWFGQGSGPVWADVFECRGNESRLSHCTVSSWGRAGCSHGQDAGVICSAQRSLRLVGAGSDCAGRLEVYHNGSWGTVCDDSWGLADSQVVCKQLQCGTALSAPVPASFSQGTGTIWLNKVGCLGNESSLWECPSAGWGQHDCGHKEDVGVVCSEFKELRLAEGCSGQLEVFYNGTWGNVCWNSMSEDTVSLICQELNCGKSGRVVESRPRRDSAPHWLDEFKCRPHDSTLWHCPSSAWNQNQCTDSEVALITCSDEEKKSVPRSFKSCSTASGQDTCSSSTRTTPQTQQLGGLSISLPVLLPLGALLFVVLALLVWQLIHNRKLRKGELMSSVKEEAPEYYDDTATVPQSPDAFSDETLDVSQRFTALLSLS
nr:PREDICTED: scavenger receptor cysteine-rich type 1 protein M130-like [Lepisosteus oculatus]